ncbi:hypothetical protein ACHAPT_004157 [Fusarium lateritium]
MDPPHEQKFGLIRLPPAVMMQIFDQLPKASHRAVALVCKSAFRYYCPSGKFPKLEMGDLFELLLLLEQGRPNTFVCFNCLRIGHFDHDGEKGWQTLEHQHCGSTARALWSFMARDKFGVRCRRTRIDFLPVAIWKPEAQGPEITFAEAHLVMNWHRTGGRCGLPISILDRHYSFIRLISIEDDDVIDDHFPLEQHRLDNSWNALPSREQLIERQSQLPGAQTLLEDMGVATPWAFTHDYKAMIINDELYLSRTHHVKGPLVPILKFFEVLETLALPVCEHIRCYQWRPCPIEPWGVIEIPFFIRRRGDSFILRGWVSSLLDDPDLYLAYESEGLLQGRAEGCHSCYTDYIVALKRDEKGRTWDFELSTYHRLGSCRTPKDSGWAQLHLKLSELLRPEPVKAERDFHPSVLNRWRSTQKDAARGVEGTEEG